MVHRLVLSCVLLFCMTRELLAQDFPIRHEGQDLPELPTSMGQWTVASIPMPKTTPAMVDAFLKSGQRPYQTIEDVGDYVLLPVDLTFDCIVKGFRCLGTPEPDTITARVMSIDVQNNAHLFTEFITYFNERESKFLGGINGTYLSNPGVENGTATIDRSAFMVEQRKVMWDVLKKTYFSKYRFQAEERIHEDAFYFNNWKGMDFVALPPFLAGYVYFRGLDKQFNLGEFHFRALIEPGQRLFTGNVTGAMMFDVRPRNWPVGIVASTGLYNGKPEFEFIGIGTTIDAVKKAIVLHTQ